VTLRYVVTPHLGPDAAAAKKLGLEASAPLIAVAAGPASPVPRFPLALGAGPLVATRLKPSADGTGWILRLYNASSEPETLRLAGEALDRGRVFLGGLEGSRGPAVPTSLEVPGFGILTLLVSR